MPDALSYVVVSAILVLLVAYGIRRRARMTPEQRMAEDQLNETRRLRRAIERRNRYD